MNDLFPEVKSGKTCKTCKHRLRYQCGGSIFQYCGVIGSGRTQNGNMKIKCKDPACTKYEKK
jgi:hypothetical protein